jgi:signal transduction histidine kinase
MAKEQNSINVDFDFQSKEIFKQIISKVPVHIYWKDVNAILRGCNEQQAKTLNFNSPNEVIGKTNYDMIVSYINEADRIRQAEEITKLDMKVIKDGKSITAEEPLALPSGEERIYLSNKSPLVNSSGEVIGLLGISFDITAEKLNEQYKHQKEKAEEKSKLMSFYETILDLFPGHVYWLDLNGAFIGCNKQQALTAGFSDKSKMIGKTNYDMPWASQAEYLNANNRRIIESGELQTFEEPFEIDGKQLGTYLTKKLPLRDENGNINGLLGVSFDITAEKENQKLQLERLQLKKEKAEEKARLMAFYETILDLFPGHVFWLDLNDTYLGCNKQQALTAGFSDKSEMIGKTNKNLPWAEQADYYKKNNEMVIKSGKLHTIEEPLIINGEQTAVFLTKKQPLRDENGNISGILGVSFDITAEKENQRLQLEKLQLEKEAAERKVELMELLAGAMAHELRTPLGALSSYAEGMHMQLPKLIEAYKIAKEANLELPFIGKQQLEAMSRSATSMQTEVRSGFHFIDMLLKNIQQDLRGYSFEPTSLKECIATALDRYPIQMSQQHIIKVDIQKDVVFNGNKELMVHVLFNLLKNALFYVGAAAGSEIVICIPANEENKLIFRDNGPGITPDILPHIFEKFYSKSKHGTGIGLAFCQMVIENFNASISCESELGQYTEFVINFPEYIAPDEAD